MSRTLFLLFGCLLATAAFAQPAKQSSDYQGFYTLNIPGFVWQEGASVAVRCRRLTGTLNLKNSWDPVFEVEGRDPIPLSLDQTSRILLAVDASKAFDLVGLDGAAKGADGKVRPLFVALQALVEGRPISLAPTVASRRDEPASGDRSPRGASGRGPQGGGPGRGFSCGVPELWRTILTKAE